MNNNNNKLILDELFYRVGKSGSPLEISNSYIDKEGLKQPFGKWKEYISCDEKAIDKADNRTILHNEIVLDIDRDSKEEAKREYKRIIELLKKDKYSFKAYFTGSKGFHIHLIFNELFRYDGNRLKEIKEYVIRKYDCDPQKAINRCMIALEEAPHWKTGNTKRLIEEVEGINNLNNILEELEEKKETEQKEDLISSFILDESEISQMIDHAVGFIEVNGEKYRYYGVKLTEKVSREIKGLPVIVNEKVNAIVLENGIIISKYSKIDGVNFNFESEMSLKKNRWSIDSIKLFCKNKYNQTSFKEVYEEFKKFYDHSMVFDDPEWYELNALWDMVTYYLDLVDKCLIIKHEGISGTAKSKGMKISANLSFNGRKFLCPTPANFFRYRHNNKSMICIEEAERLFDLSKKNNQNDSELVEYLNGSYEKGNYVPRQNDKNINQTDEFDPFGFTRIGSIKPLRGALEKRSIILPMVKADKNDKRGNIEIPTEMDINYSKTRDLAYINGLINYKIYEEKLKTIKNNFNLANRQWLSSKPIIAMAECINDNLANRIGKFIEKLFFVRDDIPDDKSWNMLLAYSIIELTCVCDESIFISNNQLLNHFIKHIEKVQGDNYSKITSNKVTSLMAEISLKKFKCRSSNGNDRGYNLNFIEVCKILLRNEFITVNKIIKKVSEVSECQFNENKIKKIFTDTLSDTLNDEVSVSDKLTDMTLYSRVDKENLVESIPSDDDLITFISERMKVNSKGYCMIEFGEKYNEKRMNKLLEEGRIMENPSGFLKVI